MTLQNILYIVIIISTLVLTGTLVVVCVELIEFLRSGRRAADDTSKIAEDMQGAVHHLSKSANAVATTVDEVVAKVRDLKSRVEDKAEDITNAAGAVVGLVSANKKRKKSSS
ncbi:MAG TPA: hypothetical protein VJL27_00745 [Patescibacteria group bacterium]|nr:hypothetical protein [Patescibacteria group bacterium]